MLRTSRFFPEGDDDDEVRAAYADANVKANEYLYRRVDVADVADAHLLAMERAAEIGFGRYIISATTPFTQDDLAALRDDAPAVVRRLFPDYEAEYAAGAGGCSRASAASTSTRAPGPSWAGRHGMTSARCLTRSRRARTRRSPLARAVGAKGYHEKPTGVYTSGRAPTVDGLG